MNMDNNIRSRINTITQLLDAIPSIWPLLTNEIESIQYDLVQSLIAENNEQKRGMIKALSMIKELPQSLESERKVLNDGLSNDPS
jgi:hypothetical protein